MNRRGVPLPSLQLFPSTSRREEGAMKERREGHNARRGRVQKKRLYLVRLDAIALNTDLFFSLLPPFPASLSLLPSSIKRKKKVCTPWKKRNQMKAY